MNDTIKGHSLTFERKTNLGLIQNHVPNILRWNSWYEYLENNDTTGFHYSDLGVTFTRTYRTTTKKRIRYWHAQKKVNQKLFRLYAGTSKALTIEKIHSVAEKLIQKIQMADSQSDT